MNWFKFLLVDDPEPSQELDDTVVDILKISVCTHRDFRVMVLGGIMVTGCSTLVNAFNVGSYRVIFATGFLVVFWITVVMVKANDLLRKQTALKVM